jgi:hypothetical protein
MATAVAADESRTEIPSQLGHRTAASMEAARFAAPGSVDPRPAPTARAIPTTSTSPTQASR